MRRDRANRRMKVFQAGTVAVLATFAASAADAQSIMRTPNIHLDSRVVTSTPVAPRVNPGVANRVNPGVTTRVNPGITTRVNPGITARVVPTTPVIRTHQPELVARNVTGPLSPILHVSPNLYPSCDRDGGCVEVLTSSDEGQPAKRKGKGGGPRRNALLATSNSLTITNELVAEMADTLTDELADAAARRHGMRRVESQSFTLIGAKIGRFRIADGRSYEQASRDFATETGILSVQPNHRYFLQDQKAAPVEGDPVQYVLAKMRLPEAHTLAHGKGIRVAVIDSAIDLRHRELADSVIDSFDALGSRDGPHVHGTGIAGAIAAHARLMGSAPSAELLAIRAFPSAANGAQSNSYVILKALDYAAQKGARIVNMSFAGPKDTLIERGIDAIAARGTLLVAAAGNAGPKSPPLYPAANPNVIAVSATDAQDHLFPASNRGNHIAVAAPGYEVFLPAPNDNYQVTSGTSFSAAYVSGLVALMLERNAALTPEELRATLMRTARDLGSPGRDDQFGAGEADAFAAVEAVITPPATPVASSSAVSGEASEGDTRENAADRKEIPPVRSLEPQVSTAASEKRQ
jgi:subtilisin family serine protease